MPIINSYPLKKLPIVAEDEALISDSQTSDPRFKTKNATFKSISSFNSKQFDFTQGVPSALWTIQHNLDKFPSVTVVNESKEVMIGNIKYIDKDTITITFSAPFSGYAYLN